ncbi:MAG: phosphoribosylanthranilate isomerase [Clostridiales bacterium]|jgi:phosphoribosylanthranilate isomerase|nr:phosphoribosylanthranilate isomerase [Clostridiales bacterium]
MRIKICGLTRPEDIDAVNCYLPDYIGFVFAKSRRQVDDIKAKALKQRLDSRISAVGVFVNDDINRIIRLCRAGIIDLVQLHGEEDEDYIRELKREIPNPIIKAIRVKNEKSTQQSHEEYCDFLLFDTYHKDLYGGSGEAFDWSMVEKPKKPFFLAGGLNNDNVIQAIKQLNPYCVDISSGVERVGIKDAEKIGEIIKNIRSYRNWRMS